MLVEKVLVFGHYFVTGNEGAPFDVGKRPVLDPYDGFFDLTLASVPTDGQLAFLLNEGQFQFAHNGNTGACRELRDCLSHAQIIKGQVVWDGNSRPVVQVDDRKSFQEFIRAKGAPKQNEAVAEVQRYKEMWQRVGAAQTKAKEYRFSLVCQLPTMSGIQRSSNTNELICEEQMEFGPSRPNPSRRAFPLFLEPLSSTQGTRVIAVGSNDLNSCRVFDVTDLDQYREALNEARIGAQLKKEIDFWEYLRQ